MRNKLLGILVVMAAWLGLNVVLGRRRAAQRRELWAEATRER